jgi:murein DD-endopeptidase MepM/ murein hydrolase activator NlpD
MSPVPRRPVTERWTVLLMKGEDASVRQYSLSARSVKRAMRMGSAAVVGLSVLTVFVGFGGAARLEAHRLALQNEMLTASLEHLGGRVKELEGTIEQLTEKDAELRVVAGLDVIEDDVLEAGVGGPGLKTPESHPLHTLDADLGDLAFAVTYDLNALERRARLLVESMSDAGDSLAVHAELLSAIPSILPTPGRLSSRFSASRMHPVANRAMPHEGIDVSAPRGSAIFASANGRVVQAGNYAGYGLMVEIDHGFGFTTRYGHASKLLVRAGQEVKRGDVIAQVGATGIATGPHLHYEVRLDGRPQNPLNYVLPEATP